MCILYLYFINVICTQYLVSACTSRAVRYLSALVVGLTTRDVNSRGVLRARTSTAKPACLLVQCPHLSIFAFRNASKLSRERRIASGVEEQTPKDNPHGEADCALFRPVTINSASTYVDQDSARVTHIVLLKKAKLRHPSIREPPAFPYPGRYFIEASSARAEARFLKAKVASSTRKRVYWLLYALRRKQMLKIIKHRIISASSWRP